MIAILHFFPRVQVATNLNTSIQELIENTKVNTLLCSGVFANTSGLTQIYRLPLVPPEHGGCFYAPFCLKGPPTSLQTQYKVQCLGWLKESRNYSICAISRKNVLLSNYFSLPITRVFQNIFVILLLLLGRRSCPEASCEYIICKHLFLRSLNF